MTTPVQYRLYLATVSVVMLIPHPPFLRAGIPEPSHVLYGVVRHVESNVRVTARIPLKGLNPRALAVSPDGSKVYVAFALSGNRTTIIPKEKAPAQPSPTHITDEPPEVALIVDAGDPAWADEIQYTMPYNDLAEIDVESLTVTRYSSRLGTVNLGLGVNPQTGDVWVANTDARNQTFFEPNVRGYAHFNRVTRVDIASGEVTPFDLNPDVDYSLMPNPEARAKALAQPTSVVFDPSGDYFYVAAFGTWPSSTPKATSLNESRSATRPAPRPIQGTSVARAVWRFTQAAPLST